MSFTGAAKHWLCGYAAATAVRKSISCERGDAAFSRQVVAEECDLSDFLCRGHKDAPRMLPLRRHLDMGISPHSQRATVLAQWFGLPVNHFGLNHET